MVFVVFAGVVVPAGVVGDVVAVVLGASWVLLRLVWGNHRLLGLGSTGWWSVWSGFVGRWRGGLVVEWVVLVVVVCPLVCSSVVCICSSSHVVVCCGVNSDNTSMCCLVGRWSGTLCEWVGVGGVWTAGAG